MAGQIVSNVDYDCTLCRQDLKQECVFRLKRPTFRKTYVPVHRCGLLCTQTGPDRYLYSIKANDDDYKSWQEVP